jgi:hypothetical protein
MGSKQLGKMIKQSNVYRKMTCLVYPFELGGLLLYSKGKGRMYNRLANEQGKVATMLYET